MLTPWHMWGTNDQLTTNQGTAGASIAVNSIQLAKVGYGRPDTWSFLFQATLTDVSQEVGTLVDLFFDLMVGTGRGITVIQGFEHYQFGIADIGKQIWSSEVIAPARVPGGPTNVIKWLAAQEINVSARLQFQAAHPGTATVAVSTTWSPRTHVRPEWHEGRYPGGETEGH